MGEENAEALHEKATQLATTGELPRLSCAILLAKKN